ncbi:ATP-binding protein [Streptomyces sp. NPDC088350]|uniref:ATP-binding protein n=1 Tax=Streptomyces sp. NPDC088350 TaxID=3365854 RepID=UPI0037FEAFFA
MPSYTLICPPLETSPHIARDFVATVLRTLELDRTLVDDAILCTSELVTNACVHAKGGDGTVLWLAVEEGRLRVVVYDGDENPPVIRELTTPEPDERGGGRGLYLVDALTAGRWGHGPDIPYGGQPHPEGKAVWFDLPAEPVADLPVRRPASP